MIKLDRRNISKTMSVLLFSGEMPGNHPSCWDFLIIRNSGLWQLKWLWSGCEVTSVPLSCLLWMWSLVLKKKNCSLHVRRDGCDNTDGPFIAFTSTTVSSPSDPGVCGVTVTVFYLLMWIVFYSQSSAKLTAGSGEGKAGMTASFRDLACLWLPLRNATRDIMDLRDFFCSTSPRAPGGTRCLRNRIGNCSSSSSQLRAPLLLTHSAVEDRVRDVSWKVGFVDAAWPVQAASVCFLPCCGRSGLWKSAEWRWGCETIPWGGPHPNPEVDAKPAVSREEPWVPSYYEVKHPWGANKWAKTKK